MTKRQFIQKIKSILEYNSTYRLSEREKSGKVNSKRLGRFPNERLFSKHEGFKDHQYVITLLVDGSGSMNTIRNGTRNYDNATEAVKNLMECFYEIPGIKFEIVVFGSTDVIAKTVDDYLAPNSFGGVYEQIYKGNTQYLTNGTDIIDVMSGVAVKGYHSVSSSSFGNYNTDHLFIQRALSRNKNNNHILIVLSDGAPTPNYHMNNLIYDQGIKPKTIRGSRKEYALSSLRREPDLNEDRVVEREMKKLIKSTRVPLIGIGLDTDYVRKFYHYWAYADDAASLFQGITRQLSRIIKKN